MLRRLTLLALLPWLWACADGGSQLPEPYASVEVPQEMLASQEARQRGRELYLEHCVLCHGQEADGRGVRHASLKPPPKDYADLAWRQTTSPRKVYYAISEGIQGTAMPAWDVLDDEQRWALTAYVLSVAEEGPYVAGVDDAAGSGGEATS
jgi:high-affinity iron transporter